MRVTSLALFGVGYVIGTKAGRERYEQIVLHTRRLAANVEKSGARELVDDYVEGRQSLAEMIVERDQVSRFISKGS